MGMRRRRRRSEPPHPNPLPRSGGEGIAPNAQPTLIKRAWGRASSTALDPMRVRASHQLRAAVAAAAGARLYLVGPLYHLQRIIVVEPQGNDGGEDEDEYEYAYDKGPVVAVENLLCGFPRSGGSGLCFHGSGSFHRRPRQHEAVAGSAAQRARLPRREHHGGPAHQAPGVDLRPDEVVRDVHPVGSCASERQYRGDATARPAGRHTGGDARDNRPVVCRH